MCNFCNGSTGCSSTGSGCGCSSCNQGCGGCGFQRICRDCCGNIRVRSVCGSTYQSGCSGCSGCGYNSVGVRNTAVATNVNLGDLYYARQYGLLPYSSCPCSAGYNYNYDTGSTI